MATATRTIEQAREYLAYFKLNLLIISHWIALRILSSLYLGLFRVPCVMTTVAYG